MFDNHIVTHIMWLKKFANIQIIRYGVNHVVKSSVNQFNQSVPVLNCACSIPLPSFTKG